MAGETPRFGGRAARRISLTAGRSLSLEVVRTRTGHGPSEADRMRATFSAAAAGSDVLASTSPHDHR